MNSTFAHRRRGLLQTLGAGASMASMGFPGLIRAAQGTRAEVFRLGVASGEPHPEGFTLWTRLMAGDSEPLPAEVSVQWEVAADEQFRQLVQRGEQIAHIGWAHSVHVDVRGLVASRPYWYRFTALGQQSGIGRTRTAPEPATPEPLHVVTANCQRWDHGHYAAWHQIGREVPDLVLFLGDYIYEYGAVASRI